MSKQQGGQDSGSGMEGLYYSGAFVIIIAFSWYYYHGVITTGIFNILLYESYAILFPLNLFKEVSEYLLGSGNILDDAPLVKAVQYMQNTDPNDVTMSNLQSVMSSVGWYVAFFFSPIWASMSLYLIKSGLTSKYREIYTLESLRNKESINWPYISTVTNTKLLNTDLDEGDFAMSIQPMDFAKSKKLLNEIVVDGKPAVVVDKIRATQTFSLQIGPSWEGDLQNFPPHVLALFAAFAAKAEHDTDSCNKLLMQIAASSKSGSKKLDYSGTYALLDKHLRSMNIAKVVGPHAYLLPAMASLLEAARGDGVLASAEFLWLKMIDRPLWYMLSSVGRPTAFAEAAGPFAHWKVEKRLRRPLKTPVVEEAVTALEIAIAEVIYKPDE